jgi:hypothetical protein
MLTTLKAALVEEGYATVTINEEGTVLTETLTEGEEASTLKVEAETDGEWTKVKATISHEGDENYLIARCRANDDESEEALAKVITDQVDYWLGN